jgi:hypothetical protein
MSAPIRQNQYYMLGENSLTISHIYFNFKFHVPKFFNACLNDHIGSFQTRHVYIGTVKSAL